MRNTQGGEDPRLLDGAAVFDARGEKVGTIHGRDETGRYLKGTKGWFFPRDTYVPHDAIGRSDAEGLYLTLSHKELRRQPGESVPEEASRTEQAAVELAAGELRVPVYQEKLLVETRVGEAGRVHVHTEVIREQETVTVALRRERVTVERVALGEEIDPATIRDAFVERDIEIAVLAEKAVVGKRVAGVEEVVVHKDVVTVRERVTDTVRKEHVRIEEEGRTGVPTANPAAPVPSRRRGKKRRRR